MNKVIEPIKIKPDPYGFPGDCWITDSKSLYAPEGDIENKLDVLRITLNDVIKLIKEEE